MVRRVNQNTNNSILRFWLVKWNSWTGHIGSQQVSLLPPSCSIIFDDSWSCWKTCNQAAIVNNLVACCTRIYVVMISCEVATCFSYCRQQFPNNSWTAALQDDNKLLEHNLVQQQPGRMLYTYVVIILSSCIVNNSCRTITRPTSYWKIVWKSV